MSETKSPQYPEVIDYQGNLKVVILTKNPFDLIEIWTSTLTIASQPTYNETKNDVKLPDHIVISYLYITLGVCIVKICKIFGAKFFIFLYSPSLKKFKYKTLFKSVIFQRFYHTTRSYRKWVEENYSRKTY